VYFYQLHYDMVITKCLEGVVKKLFLPAYKALLSLNTLLNIEGKAYLFF